ncbi:MAG: FtsW/RodA/SpoVE family cell cycle protein [Lachnospiraceae bacterium]|nr:FtsW/RodA/SpoVE family cell cycle protein [Lachnospiraceae bacterium]MDD6628852.1 FtsW/RodA/SpoVE family cell cycle protein [Lachnospiraceae bacterium]
MELYITELSKYFITLFIALYTLECFLVFRFPDEESRRGSYIRQNLFMFLVHFSCFLVICFETGKIEYLLFYALQQILLFSTIVLFRMIYPKGNRLIINNMCMLLSIGFIILSRLSFDKAIKQFFIVTVSVIVGMLIPFFIHKLKFLKSLTWIYAAVGIVGLAIVLILGSVTNGSKISYSVGGVTFQPSEFVKIIFVFFLASALCETHDIMRVMLTAILAGIHVLILVASKDLGSALIFFVVYVMMVFIATGKWIYLFLGSAGGCGAAMVAYHFFSHVQVRVQAWRDPFSCIEDAGYQITQSLFAISSGGWFGLGLFRGNPTSIPFVEADFIFSAVAEELGIIFSMCMILICISCFIMFMNIAVKLQNKFYHLIAFGLGVTYIFQVFLTIGGGTKFIPMTGITLPLISYGGSSVLTTLVMFFIIEGLYIIRQDEGAKRVKKKKKRRRRRTEYEDFENEEKQEAEEEE